MQNSVGMSDLLAAAIPSPPPAKAVMEIFLGRGLPLLGVLGRRRAGEVVVVEGRGMRGWLVALLQSSLY